MTNRLFVIPYKSEEDEECEVCHMNIDECDCDIDENDDE